MNTLRAELRLLRWPLLWLGCALLLALAVGMTCWHVVKKAKTEANGAVLESLRLQTEANRLAGEQQEMRARIAEFQAIGARGIIGPERRLEWVELIRSIQVDRQLLGLNYEIQPQATLSNANGAYAFMNSVMRVQIPLLHEEDLMRFIGDLQARAPAFVRVRSCRVVRGAGPATDDGAIASQLQADCQLDWITLRRGEGERK
jgi:hypothetical protein